MVQVILLATLTAAVAQGTPLLITALGEIMTQRSGVLNLGLEGMMLIGAAASFIALVNTNSLILAVLIGALCSGLLALAGKLGLRRDQVMAVGDSGNDLSMIEDAGLGVAMGNATPEILAAADAVTADNNHDGVALAIEKYALHR